MTRPDISLAVQKVSRQPWRELHTGQLSSILCYPKGTRDFVPTLSVSIDLSTAFEVYCDADHVNFDVLSQATPSSSDLAPFPGQQRNKRRPPGLLPKPNTMRASTQDKRSRGCTSYSPRSVFLRLNPPHSILTTRPQSASSHDPTMSRTEACVPLDSRCKLLSVDFSWVTVYKIRGFLITFVNIMQRLLSRPSE